MTLLRHYREMAKYNSREIPRGIGRVAPDAPWYSLTYMCAALPGLEHRDEDHKEQEEHLGHNG